MRTTGPLIAALVAAAAAIALADGSALAADATSTHATAGTPARSPIREGLLLDLDADRGVTVEDGDRVVRWTNQVPGARARDFVKRDKGRKVPGSGRPTLRRKVAEIGGHDTLVFRRQELLCHDEDAFDRLITGNGYTWFAVLCVYEQLVQLKDVNTIFGNLRSGGNYEGIWANVTDDNRVWIGSRNAVTFGRWDANNPMVVAPEPLETKRFYAVAGRMGAGTGTVKIEVFIDEPKPVASLPFPVNPKANSSVLAVGQERDATNHPGVEAFDGELARLLIYERPLSDAELARTLTLLKRTYGLDGDEEGEEDQTEAPAAVGPREVDPRNPGVPWPATDALGRELPLSEEVGPPKPDRFVGIFYFLWLGQHDRGGGPYDVAKILAKHPDAVKTPTSPPWGPVGAYHWWSEPLYGYYLVSDPWVLRRHARLLTDAGVDTLIFDATNRVTYRPVYEKLCETFRKIRSEGGRTPQLAFMVNTRAGETAEELYRDLYRPRRYEELWFRWKGKPLLLCDPAQASEEVRAFFTLRRAHWPFTMVNTDRAWHWEAAYPQPYGYVDDPEVPEQVNVSVAQNLRRSDGKVTNMSRFDARGRSFHDGKLDTRPGAVDHGHNFQEQWKRALELDPPFVMVTSWNEWIAGRWKRPDEPFVFVDQFDQEYSRDIEPMRGGHGDNYYLQLVANVRRYKGVPPLPEASAPRAIAVDGSFAPWRDVRPEYRDAAFDTLPRDHAGASGLRYANRSGRNDLVSLKVCRDARAVYFYARTRQPLTPPDGPAWMVLLVDADQDPTTGQEGYEHAVRRRARAPAESWLEEWTDDGTWRRVARVDSRTSGAELHLAIPRRALGLPEGDAAIALDFRWSDGLQRPDDAMDVYLSGDVAPESRFRFRYRAGGSE